MLCCQHAFGSEVLPCRILQTSLVAGIAARWLRQHNKRLLCLLQDHADTIRSIYVGVSAHQKLELLSSLVKLLGYESLAVFGDCFDEVRWLSVSAPRGHNSHLK